MNESDRRRGIVFRPDSEQIEGRLLLSSVASPSLLLSLRTPPASHPARPNTPVLPFGATTKTATFVDTSVRVIRGSHIFVGKNTYIAPFATMNASSGFIKIGSKSNIQDNATIVSNPTGSRVSPPNVFIGDSVVIGIGATVYGPSTIGVYGSKAKPTLIGANAQIDGATIEPGAIVGPLARVGPGVTVPSGMAVLPGMNVTTNAQASDPSLGMVTKVTSTDTANIKTLLTDSEDLAVGYTTLYQGDSSTGVNPGANSKTVFQGNLSTVEGISSEPGMTDVKFEPASGTTPTFLGPDNSPHAITLWNYPNRIIGGVSIGQTPSGAASAMGRFDSIRGDEGQPIKIGSIASMGNNVTITSPIAGAVTIGNNLTAQTGSVILGGPKATNVSKLGDNVNVGAEAVILSSKIGNGATIGQRSYIADSTIPAGAVVPAGTIMISNKVVGTVQW